MHALGIDIGGSCVKVCSLGGGHEQVARGSVYSTPSRGVLAQSIREAIGGLEIPRAEISIGLCLPGRADPEGDCIERSINLPCLEGWRFSDLLDSVLDQPVSRFRIESDVYSAGYDFVRACPSGCQHGRVAALAIGTGVGLCVLDDGQRVTIGDRGIGHIGQIDIGRIGGADRVAPDGAINTLESYIGARAWHESFGIDTSRSLESLIGSMPMTTPQLEAVVRAMRIVHAIYSPDQIALLGGVGRALRVRHDDLYEAVNRGLTSLAHPGWTLAFGDSIYHAARGVASLCLLGSD